MCLSLSVCARARACVKDAPTYPHFSCLWTNHMSFPLATFEQNGGSTAYNPCRDRQLVRGLSGAAVQSKEYRTEVRTVYEWRIPPLLVRCTASSSAVCSCRSDDTGCFCPAVKTRVSLLNRHCCLSQERASSGTFWKLGFTDGKPLYTEY